MGFWKIEEKRHFCQPQEVLFSQRQSPLPRVRRVSPRSLNKRGENRCRKELTWTKIHMWYSGFLGFVNFYYCFIQGFSRIAAPLTLMPRVSAMPTLVTQKLMDLVDEFGKGDHGANKARKTSVLTKRPIGADYPSFNYVSHAVSNFAINVSNYLTPDAKRAFDQLRQVFT